MPTLEHQLNKLIERRCWDHAHHHNLDRSTAPDHSSLTDNWLAWKIRFGVPVGIHKGQILLHICRDGAHKGRRHLSVTLGLEGCYSVRDMQTILPYMALTALFIEDLEADCRALLGPETGPVSEADHAAPSPA